MRTKKQYEAVQDDDWDSRVPLHPEDAFHHGIPFQAKYIGTLDVPRPTSRVEIVAAMRRIRYEFKARGVKKKKIRMDVGVDGVRVSLRKKKKPVWPDDLILMHHPIHRIFYVSHDSQDMNIFSYIARDAATNVFKCNVFKANKKNQAMRIVRTIGQAFEVCHKLSSQIQDDDAQSTERRHDEDECVTNSTSKDKQSDVTELEPLPPPPPQAGGDNLLAGEVFASPKLKPLPSLPSGDIPTCGGPLSAHHEAQLLREQLEAQLQQTQAAVAQNHLLKEQLSAESSARMEAQSRTHHLLRSNQQLLEHIRSLVLQLVDMEAKLEGSGQGGSTSNKGEDDTSNTIRQVKQLLTSLPQMPILVDPQTPATPTASLFPPPVAPAAEDILRAQSQMCLDEKVNQWLYFDKLKISS